MRKKIKYSLLYAFVRSLLFLAGYTPRKIWVRACGALGSIAWHVLPKTRQLTLTHLQLALGNEKSREEIHALSKQVFRYLGRNAGDIFRSFHVQSLSDLEKFLTTYGYENFERAHQKGKGVIFLTAHLGAFDLQITNMALRGLKPNIIGTALKDERLNRLLQTYRNKFGAVAVERGKESIRLFKALRQGESIAILIDQDTQVKSVFVPFFGMPAHTPIGATVLALKSGASVVPTFVYMDKNLQQHMHILPELTLIQTGDEEQDILQNTTLFTEVTERWIRQHPEQWVWMHERWKTKG